MPHYTDTTREADYYQRLADNAVRCGLCPHRCLLNDGHRGLCRTRRNVRGRLYADGYMRVCALEVDPVEKKPLFHFLPATRCLSIATMGCNLACHNCQNHKLSQAEPGALISHSMSAVDVAQLAIINDCPSVAFTYTEPLVNIEFIAECAAVCREHGLRTILVTAGYVEPEPLARLLPLIDAANVDLKSMSDATYRRLCHASLEPVLRTIRAMMEAGVWVEVTRLLVTGLTDAPDDLATMYRWLIDNGLADQPLHLTRFFPHYILSHLDPTPLPTIVSARDAARAAGLSNVYIGNTSIHAAEDTICPNCGATAIHRSAYRVAPKHFDGRCPHCHQPLPGVWK